MNVQIENFQALEDISLDIEGLTVLVGATNKGKSAVIRAVTGALFNRPGDDYVRTGAKLTRVTLTGLPVKGATPIDVVWEKGTGGVNRFTVNGEKFTSVGRTAPLPLQEAGYRDLPLDERTTLRPQVAGQFESPFLLSVAGSTVSDILTRASRLDVLLRANAACAKDLKSTRQILGVRRTDLGTARAVYETIETPVRRLRAQVETLQAKLTAIVAMQARLDQVRTLLARRAKLTAALDLMHTRAMQAPVVEFVTRQDAQHVQALRRLVPALGSLAFVRLGTFVFAGIPDPAARARYVEKAGAAAARIETLRRCTRVRRVLGSLTPMPERSHNDAWILAHSVEEVVRPAVDRWRRVAPVRALTMPEPSPAIQGPGWTVLQPLRELSGRFLAELSALRRAQASDSSSGQELEQVLADRQELLRSLKVCPVCEQVVP